MIPLPTASYKTGKLYVGAGEHAADLHDIFITIDDQDIEGSCKIKKVSDMVEQWMIDFINGENPESPGTFWMELDAGAYAAVQVLGVKFWPYPLMPVQEHEFGFTGQLMTLEAKA